MQATQPQYRVEFLMTETYQFLITVIVLLGGGFIVWAQPEGAVTNVISGFIGVVLTFWFASRSNIGGGSNTAGGGTNGSGAAAA